MPTVQATELKTLGFSEDGRQLIIKLATKYVGELEVVLPATSADAFLTALTQLRPAAGPETSKPTKEITVSVPRTWLVTKDARRQAVILVFDHQAETRRGFALDTVSVAKLVEALSKNADAIAKGSLVPPPAPPKS